MTQQPVSSAVNLVPYMMVPSPTDTTTPTPISLTSDSKTDQSKSAEGKQQFKHWL